MKFEVRSGCMKLKYFLTNLSAGVHKREIAKQKCIHLVTKLVTEKFIREKTSLNNL